MNKCMFIGRTGKDMEFHAAVGQQGQPGFKNCYAKFSLAVDRPGGRKDANGNKITDWVNFTAFGKTAELLNQFCQPKGTMICVSDCVHTVNNYVDKNQQNRTSVDMQVKEIELSVTFAASKANGNTAGNNQQVPANNNYNNQGQVPANNYNQQTPANGNSFADNRNNQQTQMQQQPYNPPASDDMPF